MIKFTDIRRNANVLLGHEKETAIIKHSQVVGYIVPVERMNELLSAEEQFENGYMAQKNEVVPTIVDLGADDIKAGDTVRIKSLFHTEQTFGSGIDQPDTGYTGVVENIFGVAVIFRGHKCSYHIDDLELVK